MHIVYTKNMNIKPTIARRKVDGMVVATLCADGRLSAPDRPCVSLVQDLVRRRCCYFRNIRDQQPRVLQRLHHAQRLVLQLVRIRGTHVATIVLPGFQLRVRDPELVEYSSGEPRTLGTRKFETFRLFVGLFRNLVRHNKGLWNISAAFIAGY